MGTQAESLLNSILEQVGSQSGKILLWGINPTCLYLLNELSARGLLTTVAGIIDSRTQGTRIYHLEVQAPSRVSSLDFDTLVITDDAGKESALLEFSRNDPRMPRVLIAGTDHLLFRNSDFDDILESCSVKPRALGYKDMLIHIYQSIAYLASRNLRGAVAEFGVYQGGTTAFIAKTLRKHGVMCKIYGFDTFAGFPERKSVLDLFQEPKYKFTEYDTVSNYLRPLGVELIKGDISETFVRIKGIPLMFSLFDTDNYSPTRDALDLCYEQTVSGGIIAFDHFYCDERWVTTVGERIAVKQVLTNKHLFNLHGTGIFLKS